MSSEFFESFFSFPDTNRSGEAAVCCPFEHDKGFESRPSAHVNTTKNLFHCKTCEAEGRPTGFSDVGFVAHLYGISYGEAIKFMTSYDKELDSEEDWSGAVELFQKNQSALDALLSRGITKETALQYKIGYTGTGYTFPVFINHVLVDKRTYNPNWKDEGTAKIKSERGATCMLFPFDDWKEQLGKAPTLLCAGEHDTLLARQNGFNAVTSTMGEGSFPQIFTGMFKDQDVYICYDCDEAGKKSASRVAFLLFEAGARPHLINLGLEGTKESKDLTDFFIKHNHSVDDLYKLMQQASPFSGELYVEEKNKAFPLINLWEIEESRVIGKHVSSRVMMMGKIVGTHGATFEVPSVVQYGCDGPKPNSDSCVNCQFAKGDKWWSLDDDYEDLITLVEMDRKSQEKFFAAKYYRPDDCPGKFETTKRDRISVQHVILSPEVDSEDELRGYRGAEIHAYVTNPKLEDGQRYRVFYQRYAHPKNNAIVMVVDKVENSDNAIDAFKVTPQIMQQLSQFQGHPKDVMQKRYEMAKLVVAPSVPQMVQEAVDIIYHSVLDFRYGLDTLKGHPEGAIIGESRTGKSQTAKKLMQFYGLGNHTEMKGASYAGLVGGAEGTASGWRIRWGKIPRNNRGLVILDEANELPRDVLSKLTGVRSERIAVIEKIASGQAPALTRLLWIANPRTMSDGTSKPVEMYNNGVQVLTDLFGTNQDIARLDFTVILPKSQVYIAPFRDAAELEKLDNAAYRNLIKWAWSRSVDQIKFATGVEEYIWTQAQEMNELYDTRIGLFGSEAHIKLARISVSCAAMCFSHDGTGNVVLVSKDHVDYARSFLSRCYDNAVFRIREFVEQERMYTETTEEVNNEFEKIVRKAPVLIQTLDRVSEVSTFQLQTVSALDRNEFNDIMNKMVLTGLVTISPSAVKATMRFKKAKDAYNQTSSKTRMVPLSQQGRVF